MSIAIAVGIAAVGEPAITLLCAFGALITVGIFLAPRVAIPGIGVFLLIQPVLSNLAGGVETPVGLAVRRLHELVVIGAILRIAVVLGWRRLPKGTGFLA